MLNVSSLTGVRQSPSDALRYGVAREGEPPPKRRSTERRPVVVWNTTRGCNLRCAHCYASARLVPFDDELSTAEGRALLDDLAGFGVPAVLISGGEPLTRPDLPSLVEYGSELGLRFTLSTNGMLIDQAVARVLREVGVIYVGVSIDGAEEAHNALRRHPDAHRLAIEALRNLGEAGVRRGVRFTLSPATYDGLDDVLSLVLDEGIERFCMYHLVPAGRGGHLADVSGDERLDALFRVFEFACEHPEVEVLTVDNPSDGAALHRWLEHRDPIGAQRCLDMLEWNGGGRGGPGIALACVSERGDVHPDQFSRHRVLGNIRERPFSTIWTDGTDSLVQGLRSDDPPLSEHCRECPYLTACGGGLRSRAELSSGDPWALDPSCTVMASR